MSVNTFGRLLRCTTWGESHGPAIGVTVDGCPPGIPLAAEMLQHWLDRRRPGTSRFTTQRREPDSVEILSGTFEGKTTGTPIQLLIANRDQRSKDYSDISDKFRPGHADYTYWTKYGIRDHRGGGRSSARETAARVAAGGVAREILTALAPSVRIVAWLAKVGDIAADPADFDPDEIERNPFWSPSADAAKQWATLIDCTRKSGDSIGAAIECAAYGVPAGLGLQSTASLMQTLRQQ